MGTFKLKLLCERSAKGKFTEYDEGAHFDFCGPWRRDFGLGGSVAEGLLLRVHGLGATDYTFHYANN